MTPTPLLLLIWGALLAAGVLPDRIGAYRVPPSPAWRRARRIIGAAAVVSGGFWLGLDLTLPLLFDTERSAARAADIIGWSTVLVAAAVAALLIARPTRYPGANSV